MRYGYWNWIIQNTLKCNVICLILTICYINLLPMELTEVTMAIHWLIKQEWIWNEALLKRNQLKNQLCFYSHYTFSLLFISWKGSLRSNNLSFTKSCLNSPFGSDKVVVGIVAKWKQVLAWNLRGPQDKLSELQKFTSCRIARDLRISHRCIATLLISCHPEKRRNQPQYLRSRLLVMGKLQGIYHLFPFYLHI